MSLRSPFLHVGLHKTGTTWLQTTLFADPATGFCLPWNRPTINEQILLTPWWSFDPDRVRNTLMRHADSTCELDGCRPVISNENLSGNPYVGDFNAHTTAERLHAVFPDSRVLLVIREQRSMLRSSYLQYIRAGGGGTFRQYVEPPRHIHKAPVFSLGSLHYDHLIEAYQSLFGAESVLVLPFEMFTSAPEDFVVKLVGHADARMPDGLSRSRPQSALSYPTISMKRRWNKLIVRDAINPSPMFDSPALALVGERAFVAIDRRLPARVRRLGSKRLVRLVDRSDLPDYSISNRRVEELTGLDLTSWGYE